MQTLERKFDLSIKKIQEDLRSQKTLGLFHSFHFFSHFPIFSSLSLLSVCPRRLLYPTNTGSTLPWKAVFLLPRCPLQDVCSFLLKVVSYTLGSEGKGNPSNPRLHYYHRIMIYCWNFTLILFYQSPAFSGLFFFSPGIPNSSSVKVVYKPILCTKKVKGKITACYSIKNPANGYDFPKYNQVSGWLASWLAGWMYDKRKTLHSVTASEV